LEIQEGTDTLANYFAKPYNHRNPEVERVEQHDEIKMRFFAEALPQIVWTARPDGWIDYFNNRWFEYTGFSFQETQGWDWKPVIHPDDFDRTVMVWTEALRSGQPLEIEYRFKRADGQYRWHLGRALPVKDENGEITKWFGFCTDIHAQKEQEQYLEELVSRRTEELQLALEQSLVANRVKGQFVSTISHEVRTPMSGVIGLAEILTMNDDLDDESKAIAAEIYKSSKRLVLILNDILDFSKFEAGHLRLEHRSFSMRSLVGEVIEASRVSTEKKALPITRAIDPAIPDTVLGDHLRISQVLSNLIDNAIKFTEKGSVHVKVGVLSEATDSLVAKVSVIDTGIGISTAAQAKLFKPFSQADDTITRRYGGTGLGLSICKNFVELMGGSIGIESRPNEGSTFWFTVPLARGESAA
jgi:PAS domain S-box-containing protein